MPTRGRGMLGNQSTVIASLRVPSDPVPESQTTVGPYWLLLAIVGYWLLLLVVGWLLFAISDR